MVQLPGRAAFHKRSDATLSHFSANNRSDMNDPGEPSFPPSFPLTPSSPLEAISNFTHLPLSVQYEHCLSIPSGYLQGIRPPGLPSCRPHT